MTAMATSGSRWGVVMSLGAGFSAQVGQSNPTSEFDL